MSPKFFPHAQADAGNSARSRPDSAAGGLFEHRADRRRAGNRRRDRAGAGALLAARRGTEGLSFHAGTGRGGQRPGYWHLETGVEPARTNGWLVFIDPFHLDAESWIRSLERSLCAAAGVRRPGQRHFSDQQLTQVYLNGDVFEDGGVAISVGGDVKLAGVISQGCTPIGETWTLTRVEKNLIHHIGNRPAYAVLEETFQKLPPEEQQKAQRQPVHRPGRQRIPRGFSSRRFSRAQPHRRRPEFRRAGRRRAAARGADDAIPAARRRRRRPRT